MAPPGGSSLTDPTVQISRSGFLKRDSLFKSRAADPRLQQRVSAEEGIVFRPRQPRPAGSAIEPLVPEFAGAPIELPETLRVRGSPVVLVVAPELGIEGFLLLAHRCMSVLLAPCGDRREAPAEPLAHRSHLHGELPSTAARANVRQPEKVEGAGLLLPLPLRTFLCVAPKFHQPCLLRVKRQTVFREPLR